MQIACIVMLFNQYDNSQFILATWIQSKIREGLGLLQSYGSGCCQSYIPKHSGLLHFTYQLMVGFELVVWELVVWVPQIGVPLSNPIPFMFGDPKKIQTTKRPKPPDPKPLAEDLCLYEQFLHVSVKLLADFSKL